MATERLRAGPARARVVRPPAVSSGSPSPNVWLDLQRAYGNRAVQLLQSIVVQRSPTSEELARLTAGQRPAAIFAVAGQPKFKAAASDPAELSAMTTVLKTALPNPDDCWVALKILGGQLGMSGAVSAAASKLKKDIPSQPIELSYVEGVSAQRALVIAGVHGQERQGIDVARMLIDDVLKKQRPYYSVVLVPSLFPQHADAAWGVKGKRELDTQTNRNFPDLGAEVAQYKGGQALDASGNPVKAAKDDTGTARDILIENVMLMELIDRFQPARIISIHGTHAPATAGVFADPHFLSPAKEKALTQLAAFLGMFGAAGPVLQQLKALSATVDAARTKNDVDLALATAYAIAAKAKGAASLKGRFTDPKQQSSPSVAGNKLAAGAGKENATWREDLDPKTGGPKPWNERAAKKGTSLGLYGPAKGISVFTVEPPVDRALSFYDGKQAEPKGGPVVPKAERETELRAYADAVATVLLGPDAGDAALAKQRPSSP